MLENQTARFLDFLPRLRRGICGEPSGGNFTEEEIKFALASETGSLYYYYFREELPKSALKIFRVNYISASAVQTKREFQLHAVKRVLSAAQVRFCPIKGADLAFSLYPLPSLRMMNDFDILLHPDDCERALDALRADGWESEGDYSHGHHFPMMGKGDLCPLEPHFALPGFEVGDMPQIWQHDMLKVGDYEYRLTPEMNFLMLFRHGFNGEWHNLERTITDCGLMAHLWRPDPTKLRELALRYKVSSPDIVFATFAEFFPEEYACSVAPEAVAAFRELVVGQFDWHGMKMDTAMTGASRFSRQWWQWRIAGFSVSNIRHKYMVENGKPFRLIWAYCRDITGKGWGFIRGILGIRNRKTARALALLKTVEPYFRIY